MNVGGAILGGAAAGLLGAAVWVGVGYATGYELGFLAWGVGLACGIGVAIGTKGQAGTAGGLLAAAIALVTIIGSRFVLADVHVNAYVREAVAAVERSPSIEHDDFWTGYIADRIIIQRQESGAEIAWPEFVDDDYDSDFEDEGPDEEFEYHVNPAEYPADIWTEAREQWNRLDHEQRVQFREAAIGLMAEDIKGDDVTRGFAKLFVLLWSCFHPKALLFLGLALATAFTVARNATPSAGEELALSSEPLQPRAGAGFPRAPSGQGNAAPRPPAAAPPSGQVRPSASFTAAPPGTAMTSQPAPRPKAPSTPKAADDGNQTWVPPWMRSQ